MQFLITLLLIEPALCGLFLLLQDDAQEHVKRHKKVISVTHCCHIGLLSSASFQEAKRPPLYDVAGYIPAHIKR
jgi:hypothetical protein